MMEANAYNATTTGTTTTTQSAGPAMSVDKDYIRTLPCILLLVATVIAVIFAICGSVLPFSTDGGGWVCFVGWLAFVGNLAVFFLYLLRLVPRVPFVPFGAILMGYFVMITVFSLIGFIVAAAKHGNGGPAIASAIFGVAMVGLHGVLSFFAFQKFRAHGIHYHKQECGWSTATTEQNYTATEEYAGPNAPNNPPAYGNY